MAEMRLVLVAEMRLVLTEIRRVQVAEMKLVLAEIRLVQVAEMRLVLAEIRLVKVTEMRLVQVAEMWLVQVRLVPWAPPAFLEGGGWGWGAPYDSHKYVVRFQWISTRLGGGGGCCCLLSADSTSRVGAVCLLSANSTSGGERGGAVRFWLVQPAGWGCCLSAFGLFNQQGPLLADSTSWGGGGGGGGSCPLSANSASGGCTCM